MRVASDSDINVLLRHCSNPQTHAKLPWLGLNTLRGFWRRGRLLCALPLFQTRERRHGLRPPHVFRVRELGRARSRAGHDTRFTNEVEFDANNPRVNERRERLREDEQGRELSIVEANRPKIGALRCRFLPDRSTRFSFTARIKVLSCFGSNSGK